MTDSTRRKFTRRQAITMGAGLCAGIVGAPFINKRRYQLFASTSTEYSARAVDLVQRSLVVDMLGVLTVDDDFEKRMLLQPGGFTAEDVDRFRQSNINVFHNAVGIGGPKAYELCLSWMAAWNGFVAEHDDAFMRIDSVADLDRVMASGRMGIMIGLQNAEHFRTPDDVNTFYGLGQRVSQLTYNSRNRIGNGSTERVDGGISDFGVSIVERMNEVGMAVDVSHCGDRTTLDAFELSSQPVLITHSNCRALTPGQPRAKTDEAIRAMGKAGSVMGVTNVRNFVRDREPTTVEHVIDHYDHIVRLTGIDHVGIGTDSDLAGYDALPQEQQDGIRKAYKGQYAFRDKIDIEGLEHPKKMFDLTEGFIRRGYSDGNIEAILGLNARRVLAEIWR